MTGVYDPKAFILHAASLHQGCPHCEKFSTAATRRCLDRVSVPVRLVVLSDQLPVIALVSRYLTNELIGRGLLKKREVLRSPTLIFRSHAVLIRLSASYPPLFGKFPRVTLPFATELHRVLLHNVTPFDLHVLSTPPAFVLSQNQTLH